MIYKIEIKRDEPHTKETLDKLSKEFSEKLGEEVIVAIDYKSTFRSLPWEKQQLITYKHSRLNELIAKADWESLSNETLKKIGDEITEIEYELQELWGFPKDRASHTHWLRPIKCKCPKLDNKDAWGHEYYINEECPLHGGSND